MRQWRSAGSGELAPWGHSPSPLSGTGAGPALGVYAPFNVSLYSCAGNNPTNLVDHDGHYVESEWDGICLGLGIASLVDNIAQGNWGERRD